MAAAQAAASAVVAVAPVVVATGAAAIAAAAVTGAETANNLCALLFLTNAAVSGLKSEALFVLNKSGKNPRKYQVKETPWRSNVLSPSSNPTQWQKTSSVKFTHVLRLPA
jgi:hypothetical protein